MQFAFLTNIVSPHQVPWCRAFAQLAGEEHFRYIATEPFHPERAAMGWSAATAPWIHPLDEEHSRKTIETCDVLFTTQRDFDLFERRIQKNLRTYYLFERWFKPPFGACRLLHPKYFAMCRHALRVFSSPLVTLLPFGIYAATDIFRLHQLLHGRLFSRLPLPNPPFLPLMPLVQNESKYPDFVKRMRLWGYFTEQKLVGSGKNLRDSSDCLKVLWCGRMLNWKHVETLVAACRGMLELGIPVSLELIGDGPERRKLEKWSGSWLGKEGAGIRIEDPMPMAAIRERMRASDVYVLCSDSTEGWGAVVNEAMEEGCILVGTREAGSAATLIQDGKNGYLFPAQNAPELAKILTLLAEAKKEQGAQAFATMRKASQETITGPWNPANAAKALHREVTR
ncbi:MAG: glycosyltransferase family 4 protein [Victivallales bacterium]|nr:glycosyltransferase family 4 protein [Victivallales bacterium]